MVASLAVVGGCAAPPPSTTNTVRICDDTGCGDRDRSTARFLPAEPPRPASADDSDTYRGEALATLQAEASTQPAAAYKLGLIYAYGLAGVTKSPVAAARYYDQAAAAGHAWAQYRLAQLYLDGTGVPRNPQKGLKLLFKAADSNHPAAAFNVGMLYLAGRDLPPDNELAVQYLKRAADLGVPDAQYNLALLTFRGIGTRQGLYEAFQLMTKAAQGGVVKAQTALGRLCMTGLDTMRQDLPQAERWLTLAAGGGDKDAGILLAQVQQAQKEQQDYQRRLGLLAAETALYWAKAVYQSWLTPTIVTYYY
ncbi:tetratricopeptide repeat protein [Nitrospirillum pindoramense]|uniref:TPR repeat protein n=1 Tax=Nitrospirillum amazonense TaxID=28077 RepID=A0A560GIR1_9PROT|nr:tetratricopeptide repeat protein [Nitrospirillum amazonense]TWB33852.1 TPR repeat protein [Nitrospirillum amazonense]